MPGNEHSKDRTDHPDTPGQPHLSRRSMLGAAGVGAAGLAAGAFGGLTAARAATVSKPADRKPATEHSETDEQTSTDEHVVVHLPAGADANIDVYRGTSQTRLHDPDLAARLRRAAR